MLAFELIARSMTVRLVYRVTQCGMFANRLMTVIARRISGATRISGKTRISRKSRVSGKFRMSGKSRISGNSRISRKPRMT